MDWVGFLEAQGIDYVTAGPNTKKGNISIRCPWCGEEDPSEHLSIALEKDAYGCWRNAQHAGRKPFPLVAALLNCSFTQAKIIVQQFSAADPQSLEEAVMALGAALEPVQRDEIPQGLPPEFRQIKPTGLTKRFWRYLESRGFDNVDDLLNRYALVCCQTGRWKDRVIVPLFSEHKLIGWTGRAIQNTVYAPRYMTSSPFVKNTIFNEDGLTGGDHLFITEGPFDAMKVDFYGYPEIRATCLYGLNHTLAQIGILRRVVRRYSKVYILFDAEANEQALALREYLPWGAEIATLPKGVKDPGDLSHNQVMGLT